MTSLEELDQEIEQAISDWRKIADPDIKFKAELIWKKLKAKREVLVQAMGNVN